jgi:YHS domain-containing protein
MTKDPVCGMQVNEQQATAKSEYLGKTYSFCSQSCKQQFDQSPERYLADPMARR